MKPNYEKAGGVPTEVCMWTQELSPLQKEQTTRKLKEILIHSMVKQGLNNKLIYLSFGMQ